MPLKPPDRQNPLLLCNLVFIVSNGKSIKSTLVPAAAPAFEKKIYFFVSDSNNKVINLQIKII